MFTYAFENRGIWEKKVGDGIDKHISEDWFDKKRR